MIAPVPARGITKVSSNVNVVKRTVAAVNTAAHRYGFRKNRSIMSIAFPGTVRGFGEQAPQKIVVLLRYGQDMIEKTGRDPAAAVPFQYDGILKIRKARSSRQEIPGCAASFHVGRQNPPQPGINPDGITHPGFDRASFPLMRIQPDDMAETLIV